MTLPKEMEIHDAKVSKLLQIVVQRKKPELASRLTVTFKSDLKSDWEVHRNGKGARLLFSILPTKKTFHSKLDEALREATRTFRKPAPPPKKMTSGERVAWTALQCLGARETLWSRKRVLDLSRIRTSTPEAAQLFFAASRQVTDPGGANTIQFDRTGLPLYVLSNDIEGATKTGPVDRLLGVRSEQRPPNSFSQ